MAGYKSLAKIDATIPMTILAFFPAYKMKDVKSPTLEDMTRTYRRVRTIGLKNVKLGNCEIFAKSNKDLECLLKEVGIESVG